MEEDPPGVRRAAQLLLYDRLDRNEAARDHRAAEITSRALTLSLSTKRKATSPAYLVWDTLRDARRILSRRRDPLRGAEALQDHPADGALAPPLVDALTLRPDRLAETRELVAKIVAAASEVPHGRGCLEGMALGESVEESAGRLGLSRRQVRYARQLVREMAALISERS